MGKLGFYFDQTFCTGCRTCEVACKDKNRLDSGVAFRKVTSYEIGAYPDVDTFHVTMSCNHCENPACVAACPTGAMYIAEDGTVIHDAAVCIGCKSCAAACPYGAPQYIEATAKVGKCDGCAALRAKGQNPACVDACPIRVLKFGDVDQLTAEFGPDLVRELPVLPAADTTGPSLLIKAKANALKEGAVEFYQ